MLANIGLWELQHIHRDYNKIVNCIAKTAFDTNHSLKVFTEIPREVLTISTVVQARDNYFCSKFSCVISLIASLFFFLPKKKSRVFIEPKLFQ